ncbi:MAG: hypothetical protein ACK4Y7_04470 [Caldimicrobium sp.]
MIYSFILKFSVIFFFFLSSSLYSEEVSTITITPQAYSKIIVRIPTIEGDAKDEMTSFLRTILNYHLFCLALKEPPLPGQKNKEFLVRGHLEAKNKGYSFKGEILDLFENKVLKTYFIEATNSHLLIYALANQIIEAISPYKGLSFTRLAFVKRSSSSDTLYVMDFSKKNLKAIGTANLILFPKFSPSGRKIAYISYDRRDYNLLIYDLVTEETKKFHLPEVSSPPLFSSNEKIIYLSVGKQSDVNIYQLNLEDGSIKPITTDKGIQQVADLSPDEKFLAYVGDRSGKPQVYLLNLETGKTQRISYEGSYNTSPRFSPKKPVLMYLSGKRELIFVNLKTQERKRVSLPIEITDPTFSPTGDYLIFKGKEKKEKGIFLLHLDSLLLHSYLPFSNLYYPEWGELWGKFN